MQVARPTSDISTGSWTTAPLYDKIDEVSPDDTDYVQSSDDPSSDTFEVALSSVVVPREGTQTIRVRLLQTTSDFISVRVALRQGTQVIASWFIFFPSTSFTTYDFVLSEAQIDQISDYSDLRLSITAGSGSGF